MLRFSSLVFRSCRPVAGLLALALLLLLAGPAAFAQPGISGFSPTSGNLGATVTISGSGFTGTTSVRFGEISAAFTVNSSSQITTTVPRVASTQPISVTTASGFTQTSSNFAVTRASSGVAYGLVASNFAGVSAGTNAAPAVADLDNDGKLDLLVGRGDGTIGRYEQTAANGTAFSSLGLLSTGSATIDMGTQATVAIVDLDGNGRFNLVLGRGDGTVSEYEQTGVGASTFALVQDNFSSIFTASNTATSMTDLDNDGYLELLVGKGDGITSHSEQSIRNTDGFYRIDTNFNALQLSGNAAPFCVDLDGDGLIDVLMGVDTGTIYRFEQASAGSFTVNQVTSNFSGISAGSNAKPCITDIDGDGLLDLLVGRGDGTISRYEQGFVAPAVPTISSFTPTSGPTGTSVTVSGSNLSGATAATVNGTAGTITSNTASSLVFTVGTGSSTGLVSVTTAGGTASSSSSFTVTAANSAPTDIALSPNSVAENQPVNTSVGTLSSTDPNAGNTFIYTFAAGGTDNSSFTISGNSLRTSAVFNYEVKTSYSIKIRSTDQGSLFFEKNFTVTVNDVAEVPTVTSFTPTSGAVGQSVTITGTHFNDAGAATVRFNGTTATAVTVSSNTQLTATVSSGATTGTLSVQNADGTGTSSGSFTVVGLPTVSTAVPSAVQPNSAVLGGNVTNAGGGTVTERGVVYVAGNGTPTTNDNKVANGSGTGTFSATITGLVGNTMVSVRAYAINAAGTAYGAVQTFTTGNSPPVANDDSYTVAEDSGFSTFSVRSNDTDADAGTMLVITSVSQPANGTVTFTSIGVSFMPAANFFGSTSFTYTISDGNGGSDTGTVTVTVTAVNDAPVLTASSGSTAFVAGGGAVAVDGGLTASDIDNATLASGTVSITTGLVSAQDRLAFTVGAAFGNIVGAYNTSSGVMTLTSSGATATVAQWQAALRSVTYNNLVAMPTGSSRTVSFRVNDGGLNSNAVTKTITLTTPTPVVTSLTPSSGPVGTSVVVAGSNFTGATAVSFGGTAASSFVVNSSSQITAVVAAGTTTGPFTVTTPYGVSNNNGTFTVTAASTSTALSSNANPSVFGQSVTFTATVSNTNGSATPTGTVTFKEGAATLGTGTLSAGVASFSTSALSVGSHSITAVYGAATGFATSTSAVLTQVVNAAGTTTTVVSSVNPSVPGQSVTFTATVAATAPGAGTPTGSVTFKDGATTLGTGTLNASGVATYATSALPVGTHPITAVYGGVTSFATSTSANLNQVVNKAATSTTLTSSANPSVSGQSVTFTATVAATAPGTGTPTGTVTFKEGSTTLGTGTLDGAGMATFSTSALTVGSHSITALYGTSANYATSTSAVLTQVVDAPPTPAITTLTPSSGPVGTSVSISGSNLGGATSVSFDGVAQTTITGNTATSLTVTVPAGVALGATDVVVTTPSGDSNALTFTVTPPAPVVTSVAGPANGTYRIGQNLSFAVSFDQAVTVTGTPSIALTVGSTARTASYLSGSGSTALSFRYTIVAGDLDPDGVALGSSIALNGGTIKNATNTDANPTLNGVAPTTGVLVDGVAPTAVVSTTASNPTSSSVIPVTITFSEPVTGLTAAGITVTNGTKGSLSGSGTTYTLNVTASASGTVTVRVNASAAQDAAGNPNPQSNTLSVTYTPPPVSISSFTPTNGSVGTVVTITGSGFTGATAVTINNGAVASFTVDSNTQITATVAASNTTGLIRVVTPSGTGTSGSNFIVGPAVTGVTATADGTYKAGQALTFFVAFSQAVTVGTAGGTPTVALTVGGTVRNVPYLSGSGTTTLQFRYTIVANDLDTDGVTLSGTGVDLNGGTIRNGSGVDADLDFDNVADTSGLLVDAVAPTVVISSTAGSSTATSPIPVTITFSEPVTGFSTTSIAVTNGSKGALSGSGTTYSINITPTAAGVVTVNVAANAAQDAATNSSMTAPQFSITYAPAPTISSFTPTSGPVGTSVSVSGSFFTGAMAVAFNGLAAASFTVNSTTSITAVVPVGVTAGKISVTTPNGTAVSSANFTPTAPAVLSVAVPADDTYGLGQSLDFSVLFDQVVTVTGTPRLSLTVGSTARNAGYVSGSGSRTLLFRYLVAAGDLDLNGVVLGGSIALNGGTIRNAGASNASLALNGVAPTTGVLVDGVAPTVALSSPASSPTNTSPIPLTITFSEPVTGLTLSSLTVGNGTASNLTGSGSTYTVSITPAADGLVTVNLPAAEAQDAAGNDNTAAPQFSITYTAPTVVISSLTPNSGPVGTSVSVSGSNFTGATAVSFNGTAASSFVVNSASSITAVVPAGASTGPVTVTAPIGTSNGVTFTVTLPGSSTSLSSSANPASTGQTVTFTATVTAAAGTPTGSVTFKDGSSTLGTGTLSGGVATFSTGSLAAGSHPITAVYGGSGSYAGSSSAGLTQVVNGPVVPAITSLSPNSGPVGSSLTISGSNLGGATSVSFDGGVQTTITANTATSLTVAVPASASTGDVVVTTANGVSNALPFTVTPQLEDLLLSAGSLSPAFAAGTYSYSLTVPGTTTSTTVTPTNAQISGGAITVNGTVVNSGSASGAIALTPGSNVITVVVNSDDTGPARSYTVTVTRTACVVTATAQNVSVQLNANGTATVTAAAVNNGSSSTCGSVTLALSKTAFTCADLGSNAVTLTVTDSFGGSSTAPATVTVTAPPTATLTGLSPNPAPAGTTVTATGTNLGGATALTVNGAAATITGLTAMGFTFVVPAGAAANGNVVLALPCGQSLSQPFATAYPDLTISSGSLASPTAVPAGTYGTLTVTNTGVAQLNGAVVVNTATAVSGTLLTTCLAPLTGTGSFTVAAGATLGICDPNGISASGNNGAVQSAGTRSFSPDASYVYNGSSAQSTGTGLPATVRSLTVDNPGSVGLTQGVTIAQTLTLAGAGNLVLNGQPLLLHSDASGTALIVNVGTGVVLGSTGTMQRHIETNTASGGYRHYASPVAGETVNTLAAPGYAPNFSGAAAYNASATPGLVTPFPTVFGYNQDRIASAASNYSTFDKGWQASLSGQAMLAGVGFSVQAPGAALVDFTGTFNNGSVVQSSLARTSAADGWHLLGNPYPAPLDWSTMTFGAGQSLEGMDGAMYVFQSSGPYAGTYRTYLAAMPGGSSPLIPAGSGFFVRTTTPGTPGTVRFANANRVTSFGAQPAFGRSNDARPALTLALTSPSGTADALTLYADPAATAGPDAAYDAAKLANPSGLNLATLTASGQALVIDGRPALAGRIPLSAAVPVAGSYTLTATLSNLPATTAVTLTDALTGRTTDLRTAPAYAFTATAAAPATGRFFLNLTPAAAPLGTATQSLSRSITLYPNPAHAAVAMGGLSAGASVEVLDAVGRPVMTATAAADGTARLALPAGLATGVYVVRSGSQVQRLVVE